METKNYKTEMILDTKAKYDSFVKVVVVGDSQVGKTSILKKVLKDEFNEDYTPTKGYEFNIVLIKVNDTVIKFQVWDMSGEESYRPNLLNLYRNSNLGILVYSVTSRESFNNLEDWIKKLRRKAPVTKILLLGNKRDDEEKREVSFEEGKEICDKYNLEYFEEVSAKEEFTSPNFLERGGISLLKDNEAGSNDISAGVFTQSVMLDPKEVFSPNKKQNCCL
jgi:small GTP-binding protein